MFLRTDIKHSLCHIHNLAITSYVHDNKKKIYHNLFLLNIYLIGIFAKIFLKKNQEHII